MGQTALLLIKLVWARCRLHECCGGFCHKFCPSLAGSSFVKRLAGDFLFARGAKKAPFRSSFSSKGPMTKNLVCAKILRYGKGGISKLRPKRPPAPSSALILRVRLGFKGCSFSCRNRGSFKGTAKEGALRGARRPRPRLIQGLPLI